MKPTSPGFSQRSYSDVMKDGLRVKDSFCGQLSTVDGKWRVGGDGGSEWMGGCGCSGS